jgi:hypothetical protein
MSGRLNPETQERVDTGRHGQIVNADLLIQFVQTEIDRVGIESFTLCAGVSQRQWYAIKRHEYRCRSHMADRLLTTGMGRPDLVALVCPDVPT